MFGVGAERRIARVSFFFLIFISVSLPLADPFLKARCLNKKHPFFNVNAPFHTLMYVSYQHRPSNLPNQNRNVK